MDDGGHPGDVEGPAHRLAIAVAAHQDGEVARPERADGGGPVAVPLDELAAARQEADGLTGNVVGDEAAGG